MNNRFSNQIRNFLGILLLYCCLAPAYSFADQPNFISDYSQLNISTHLLEYQDKSYLQIDLNFKLKKLWHLYWENPGDTGLPVNIRFDQKELKLIDKKFPLPELYQTKDFTNFIYSNQVNFTFVYQVLATQLLSDSVDLKVEWLTCKIDCVPEKYKITVDLKELINQKVEELIKPVDRSIIAIVGDKRHNDLVLSAANAKRLQYFAPKDPKQYLTFNTQIRNNASLTIKDFFLKNKVIPNVEGVAFLENDKKAYYVGGISFGKETEAAPQLQSSFSLIILFAFLGGIILNLMPCVFPVISIKLLEFAQLAKETNSSVRRQSLAFTTGVISFSLILFIIIELFKKTGNRLGWGFQLQSPWFVSFLIILFIFIGLSFLGIVKFNSKVTNKLAVLKINNPSLKSFTNGALVVLVATPCTAPFMVLALGATLQMSFLNSLFIFLFLGIGIASPYLLLSNLPIFRKLLPRPGAWMEKFKKIMAIPMFLTAIWLGSILMIQLGNQVANGDYGIPTIKYNPQEIERLQEEYSAIYVDFTAKWCLTCQVNKKLVFGSGEIANYFKANNIGLVVADWTSRDNVIADELTKYNRIGVPLNIILAKGKDPQILPSLLTKQSVLNKFKKVLNEK